MRHLGVAGLMVVGLLAGCARSRPGGQAHGSTAAASTGREVLRSAVGTVVATSDGQLELRLSSTATLRLQTAPTTSIFYDGRPVALRGLPAGCNAHVTFRQGAGGRNVALRVDASPQHLP